jgi:hypothetical protein
VSQPTYTLRAAGTAVSGTSVTAGAPAGVTAGDLLLLAVVCRNNNDTFTTPSGWTLISPQVNLTWAALYARIATGSGDAPPAMSSSGTNACVAQAAAFSGDVYTDLSTIKHSAVDQQGPGKGASGNDILYSDLTVTLNATLLIAMGGHNKTATSNGATLNALSGFTEIGQLNPNGSSLSFYWGYQQQTTAANFASVIQTRNGTVEALQQESLVIALRTKNVLAPKAAFYFAQNQ